MCPGSSDKYNSRKLELLRKAIRPDLYLFQQFVDRNRLGIIVSLKTVNAGDRLLIRIGIAIELLGIIMVFVPSTNYMVAAIGFVVIGIGMGPVYPAIQHMTPVNFGKRYSAAAIGLQMASAYVGSTFMPMVFGILQEHTGIAVMPVYLLVFAVLNIGLLEIAYRKAYHIYNWLFFRYSSNDFINSSSLRS